MSFRLASQGFVAIATMMLFAGAALAANEGQDDLDQASEKKLAAESLDDLAKVIELCESALNKGLDEGNKSFANNLLTGTLMQRATFVERAIVERRPRGWEQLRVLALGDLNKALKVDPQLAPAHLLIARLQVLPGGDRAAAIKAAERAAELAKDKPDAQVEALVLRANLTQDTGKKLSLFAEALKIAPQNQEALRARGTFLMLTGKQEAALADFDAAVKADPESAEIRDLRGLVLLILKRNDDAVQAFGEAIKLAPEAALPYLHRAQAHAKLRNTKEGLDDVNHILKDDADNQLALLLRSQLQQLAGDTKAAMDDVNAVLKDDPANAAALLLRAQLHQQAGDATAARADVDAALRGRRDLGPALEIGAAISAAAGDYRQAIVDLEELRKIAPKNARLLCQIAILYSANKQPRKAIERYSEALAEDPQMFLALRGRADAYLNIGKHAEAVPDYEAALKFRPKESGLLNNLAWVLATSPDDNVRDAKRSIELATEACRVTDYKESHILSTLAAGYAESGDFEKALEWSRKAVELGADDDTGGQLKKELSSYESKKPWRERQTMEDSEDVPK